MTKDEALRQLREAKAEADAVMARADAGEIGEFEGYDLLASAYEKAAKAAWVLDEQGHYGG